MRHACSAEAFLCHVGQPEAPNHRSSLNDTRLLLLPPQGAGFPSLPSAATTSGPAPLVYLPVPRSSTFPSLAVPCDVTSSTPTTITCITRPHLAADASATDPMAMAVQPRPSPAGLVRLALCDASLTGVDRLVCAYEQQAPVAGCTAGTGAGGCSFSYAWEATAAVLGAWPAAGAEGTVLTLAGVNLRDVRKVGVHPDACSTRACGVI
jgi:hypothetical protein